VSSETVDTIGHNTNEVNQERII